MKTIQLGKTGLRVSRVGFGGIPIQRIPEEEAVRVVRRCLDLGVTFIDTANGYTTSEERIGRAVAGRRERVVIATKTGARDREGALEHLRLSLERLGTDYVDLWQLHGVSSAETFEEVLAPGGAMEAARQALDAGTVRHVGVSSHSLDLSRELIASGHFETIQFPFNFVTSEPADELLPLAREHGVGFIAMKPFAGGMLDDATLALKYLLQFEDVLPDPGIERVEEIEEVVAIVEEGAALTEEERAAIERVRGEVGTRFCRRCNYCQPCPQGVRISTLLNLRSLWKRLPAERLAEGWVPDAVESGRGCIACEECLPKCPYGLPIPELVEENVAFYDEVMAG